MRHGAFAIAGWNAAIAVLIGVGCALGTCMLSPWQQFAGASLALFIPTCIWVLSRENAWLVAFFATALLLPPLPLDFGDSGPHACVVFVMLGLFVGLLHITAWRIEPALLPTSLLAFLAALLISSCFAAIYSGMVAAVGSIARVLLFSIAPFTFMYVRYGPGADERHPVRRARFLFFLAVAAAIFACADFYFQFPAPGRFAPQFVWLTDRVLRRAQGLFYEASTLGNFCAFFLVMVVVAIFSPKHQHPCSLFALVGGGAILSATLMLSFSRGSVVNVFVAAVALAFLRWNHLRRTGVVTAVALALGIGAVVYFAPAFAQSYWDRLSWSMTFFSGSDERTLRVLSGRFESWSAILDFLSQNPWHMFFGIGYKTLPYSDFAGQTLIADNTYLSLLAETGIAGLSAFLIMNIAILRAGYKAAKSPDASTAFFGTWIFCFWCGEMVQMFSGDLITYWRILPIYFWVLGVAARKAESIVSVRRPRSERVSISGIAIADPLA